MGNVRMRAEQINYGASNVKVALDDLDPKDLIALSARMDTIEAWKATVKAEEKTGASVEFTNALALPAVSVSAEIVATQDLHGFDKPWVGGAGKNKLDFKAALDYWGATYTDNGDGSYTVTAIGDSYTNPYEFLDTAAAVSISVESIEALQYAVNWRIQIYDETNARWEDITSESLKYENITAKKIRLNYSTQGLGIIVSGLQIELGSTATPYAPYANICPISGFSSVVITDVDSESHTATVTVSLGSTVYGGTLDLTSGELTITHANIASYNGETIGEPWISSMDEYTQGGTPTTGAQVVYTLATPTTTTLTAAQLALVKGYNHISANSGDITIKAYTGAPWGGDE